MRAFMLAGVAVLALTGCGKSAADDAAEKERFQREVRAEARRLVDEAMPNPHEIKPDDTPIAAPKGVADNRAPAKVASQPECWEDYCPCDVSDPDYGGADITVCRNLKMGVTVSNDLIASAASMRDARRAMREWEQDNPDF